MGGVNRDGLLLGQRYRLIDRLGRGGMSVVWRGYDKVLGRQVAVKVLDLRFAADRVFRHRIRVEAQAAARLCHPHITNVYDYGETVVDGDPVPYVVMELVDGVPLAARLGRDGALPWREAVTACAQVASALAAAHSRGVVHRDVTPGNVMLTDAGAKVVDFGISALAGESDIGPDGNLLGTPGYVAPERLNGGQVSPATDVYAVGLLLYRTLTGRLPWQAASVTQMLRAHLHADPGPLPPVAGLPEQVAELCRRCLAKNPADRPGSTEVARTLADAAGIVVPLGDGTRTSAGAAPVAGTTVLPWSATTDALPVPSGVRPTRLTRRRRAAQAVSVGIGLILVAGLAWAGGNRIALGSGDSHRIAAPADGMMAAKQPAPCRVRYALTKDTGSGFEATVTVTNAGHAAVTDWRLNFDFPGRQRVTGSESARWEQHDRSVSLRPAARTPLAPNDSVTLRIAGAYQGRNLLPVDFDLGGRACAVEVSGVTGAPSFSGGAAGARVTGRSHPKPTSEPRRPSAGPSAVAPAGPTGPPLDAPAGPPTSTPAAASGPSGGPPAGPTVRVSAGPSAGPTVSASASASASVPAGLSASPSVDPSAREPGRPSVGPTASPPGSDRGNQVEHGDDKPGTGRGDGRTAKTRDD